MAKPKPSVAAASSQTLSANVSLSAMDLELDENQSGGEESLSASIASRVSGSSSRQNSVRRPKRLSAAAKARLVKSERKLLRISQRGLNSSGVGRGRPGRRPRTQTLKITVKSFLPELSSMDVLETNVNKNTDATWLEFLTENKVPAVDPTKYLIKTTKSVNRITDKISTTLSKYARTCKHLNTVIVTQESPLSFNVKLEDDHEQEEIIVDVDDASSDIAEFNYEAFVIANNRGAEFQVNQRRQSEAENNESQQEDAEDEADEEMSDDTEENQEQDYENEQDTSESQSGGAAVTSSNSVSNNQPSPSSLRVEQAPRIPTGPASLEHIANVVHAIPQMLRNVSVVQGRLNGDNNPGTLPQVPHINFVPNNGSAFNRDTVRNVQQAPQHHYPQMPHMSGNAQPIHVQTSLVSPVAPNEVTRGEFGDLIRDHVIRAFQCMPSEDILRVRDELLTLRVENRMYGWSRHAPMTGFAILNAFHI